uniref:Putative secreted protein n=1 Tax=Ixodes scapularis TaxID=6945 RepID=A0A4D5RFU8_IXOSC
MRCRTWWSWPPPPTWTWWCPHPSTTSWTGRRRPGRWWGSCSRSCSRRSYSPWTCSPRGCTVCWSMGRTWSWTSPRCGSMRRS